MEISVIIPVLNEEILLPNLLEDLQGQSFGDFEIIVSDAGSTDRTAEIAASFGARVVQGGLPAIGRNKGARVASGNFLFFLDADVRLPWKFLESALTEIDERFLDLATCELVPDSTYPMDRMLHDFANFGIKLGQFTDPRAPGCCILISRRLFKRVGGFDESLRMAEDHDLVRRASQFRPLRVLNSTQVSVSVRRMEKEGRVGLVSKYLAVELHRAFLGEIKTDVVEYEFGNYSEPQERFVAAKMKESQNLLERINQEYNRLVSGWHDDSLANLPAESLANIREQFDHLQELLTAILTVRRR